MLSQVVSLNGRLHPAAVLLVMMTLLSFRPVAQPARADSLARLLRTEKIDTNRARLLWQRASALSSYNPDSALALSQEALYLSERIHYLEGKSRALGVMANTFIKISNYPRALELHFEKLKLEEKRNRPQNYASVLINIGVVYALQEEYSQALRYYARADSVINEHGIDLFRYNIALNVGDAYNRLNQADSADKYFSRSLDLAKGMANGDLIGTSLTGLGHSYAKLGRYPQSLSSYHSGIAYLLEANDDEILCEATLGLARLYDKTGVPDSAAWYAQLSYATAAKDGFLSQQLDASKFLLDHFRTVRLVDSALVYSLEVQRLNDSINNKTRIREVQIISSNEQFRQAQLAEAKRLAREERRQQLQMLLIGVFIPGLFLLTLSLSRARLHVRFIRVLGVLSLLFFFEYLTLLLHPTVANLTGHTPMLEILIFVVLASILIPAHHRIEHWFIQKLVQRNAARATNLKAEEEMEEKPESPGTGSQSELPAEAEPATSAVKVTGPAEETRPPAADSSPNQS